MKCWKLIVVFSLLAEICFSHKNSKYLDIADLLLYPQVVKPQIKQCACGVSNETWKPNAFNRIINGTNVAKHKYPWLALLLHQNEFFCGGTVISDLYILTAAHCMRNDYLKDDLKILLGEHDRCTSSSTTVILSISDIIKHSQFNPSTFAYDIMLLRVNMRITFNKFIRPICLPNYDYYQKNVVSKYKGQLGVIVGWGSTIENVDLSISCTPLEVAVPILGKEACPNEDESLFCAGYLDGRADACQGDSGGPLQIRNKFNKFELIGVISSGQGCAQVGQPGLYTDVLQNLNWINRRIRDSMPCWNPRTFYNLR